MSHSFNFSSAKGDIWRLRLQGEGMDLSRRTQMVILDADSGMKILHNRTSGSHIELSEISSPCPQFVFHS